MRVENRSACIIERECAGSASPGASNGSECAEFSLIQVVVEEILILGWTCSEHQVVGCVRASDRALQRRGQLRSDRAQWRPLGRRSSGGQALGALTKARRA